MDKKMQGLLNDQYNLEIESAFVYYQLSAHMRIKGLFNLAAFFKKQYHEELEHAHKFHEYMLDIELNPVLKRELGPKAAAELAMDPEKALEQSLAHERLVTAKIHEIHQEANATKDYRTHEFTLWFIKEQIEEERQVSDMLKGLKLSGDLITFDDFIKDGTFKVR